MFKDYEKLCKKDDAEGKETLAGQICQALTVHSQLEEEIFYPVVREAIDEDKMMNEAIINTPPPRILLPRSSRCECPIPCMMRLSRCWANTSIITCRKSKMKSFPRPGRQRSTWKNWELK